MLKKWMTIGFVLMLAFQPVTSVAAAPAEDEADDAQTEEAQADETDNKEANEKPEDTSEDASSEADEDAVEEDTEEAEATAGEDAEAEADAEDTEETKAEDKEEVEAQAEDEIETTATADEDLNLRDIYGKASGDITYDIAQGAYVLKLSAGFTNYTNAQDIENKWVAFALPNGVDVAGELLPSGTVPLFLKGKTGIAVKVPNVKGIGGESVNKEILLTGEPDDNDPVVNLYMLNVDTEANQYEEIGEVQGQRDIDFSVMEANPSIDLDGSLTGSTEYDDDKKLYFLNVTVDVENNTGSDVSGLYAGFDLPEDVGVQNNEDLPDEFISLGDTTGAVQLPDLAAGEKEQVTYQIPMLGKTDAVVTADEIQLYTDASGSYVPAGSFNGNLNIDFSGMDQTWEFQAKNEIITDFPGVNDNQKGFRFNYSVRNLLINEDFDKVSLEFIVPEGISIQKPQYNSGSRVEIDWDGNVATVDFGDLDAGSGYEGYFTAVGNTSLSIDQLKDVEVKVTLYRDGNEEVRTISAPFVEGKYDENDFDTPTDPGNGDDDDEGNGDAPTPPGNGNGDDDNNTGDNNNNNNGDGNNDDGNSTPGNTGNNNDGGDNDDDGDVSVEVEDGDDSVADGDASVEDGDDDNTLPNTATNMYSMLAAGFMMLALGGVFVAIRRRMA